MSTYLDRYLILSERGFKALESQAHDNQDNAMTAALKWCETTGDKIVIFKIVMIVEEPNTVAKVSD